MALQPVTQVTNFKILTKSNISSKRAKRAMSALSISPATSKADATDVKITRDTQARASLAAMQRLEEGITLGQKAIMQLADDVPSRDLDETVSRFETISSANRENQQLYTYIEDEQQSMKNRIEELRTELNHPESTPADSDKAADSIKAAANDIQGNLGSSIHAQINKIPESVINILM